jgi:protein ImuB
MMAVSPARRILSVWLRRLPTDRIERRAHPRADIPLVVVATINSARRIEAMNDAAARLGLRTGMALADARAMYPSLAAVDTQPDADLHCLETIADWCDRYTPLIGLDAPDGLFLDISGCAHLFGGEAGLSRDLRQRLVRLGFHVRAAIAPSAGGAWALAHYGTTPSASAETLPELLLPLPLAALRISSDIVAALAESGLKQVCDIIDLPRAPLAARFGVELLRNLDRALNRSDETIIPRLPLPSYVVERRFPEPVAREEDVLGTLAQLAMELSRAMERHGDGARRLQAALFRADGKVQRIEVGTGEPLRDPARMSRLFNDRLAVLSDESDPGFGFDVIRLSALMTARLDPAQTGLGGNDDAAELAHLIDRLSARFGASRVQRLVPHDTHIPEFATRTVTAQTARSLRAPAPCIESIQQDSLLPLRPIRLFESPEPVSEPVAEVPDGPPVRFRWRQILHEIVRAEGPERIAMEWWRDAGREAPARDYFRVQSRSGVRLWLYRQGTYGGHETPRWFVHGLFA